VIMETTDPDKHTIRDVILEKDDGMNYQTRVPKHLGRRATCHTKEVVIGDRKLDEGSTMKEHLMVDLVETFEAEGWIHGNPEQ
jgi:hypothetical protein